MTQLDDCEAECTAHQDEIARLCALNVELVAVLEWLAPYAEIQVSIYPDAADTPNWRKLLAAIAKAKGA